MLTKGPFALHEDGKGDYQMSKLTDAIKAMDTRTKRHTPIDFVTLESTLITNRDGDLSATFAAVDGQYEIKAEFGGSAWVSLLEPDALPNVVKATKRAVTEAVFGEFRQPLIQIEMALHNRDAGKALAALHRLRDMMFSD
jgi:hypothetical protein